MINFNYETKFILLNEELMAKWISLVIEKENCELGEINYVFCNDEYLHRLNVEYLNHDTLTDIISFDYSVGKKLHGEIYISVDRVKENAKDFAVTFTEELHRVIIHGVLHYCGYKDKTDSEARNMRSRENKALELLRKIK